VAVSGGTDSLALLHMLHTIQATLPIQLHIATFDHGLRPDSPDDVKFVQQIAALWQISITSGQSDSTIMANTSGKGIEAAARHARYTFLADVARKIGSHRIAVAHHADDQAETILMHILRGSGTQGLRGMTVESPVPGAPDLTLVRPLLNVTRAELEAYCVEHNLQPRQDSSNDNTRYSRNYIRHQVLPFLKTVNPQVDQALIRLAEITAIDQDYLESAYERWVIPYLTTENKRHSLGREIFHKLHPALQRRFVHKSAQDLGFEDFAYTHILHAVEVAQRGKVGAIAQLPHGLQLRVDYDSIVMEHADTSHPDSSDYLLLPSSDTEITLNIPGETIIPGANWRIIITDTETTCRAQLLIAQNAIAILRPRRPGDRFAPPGMNGKTQSIKKWLINKKIPRQLRDRIPLLVIDGQIAAICICDQWPVAHGFTEDVGIQGRTKYISVFVSHPD
jgi:tRNA(Ile)-lysidine synthase